MLEKEVNTESPPAEIKWEGLRTVEIIGTEVPFRLRFEFDSEIMDGLTEDEREGLEVLVGVFVGALGTAVYTKNVLSKTDMPLDVVMDKLGDGIVEIGDLLATKLRENEL